MKRVYIRLYCAWKLWRLERIIHRAAITRGTLTGTLPEPKQ